MNVEKETGSGQTDKLSQQIKTDLDIYRLLDQMGIHPDKWLLLQEEKKRE